MLRAESSLIFYWWVQMSGGEVQSAKSILLQYHYSVWRDEWKQRNRKLCWCSDVTAEPTEHEQTHLWKDAEPGPCIDTRPFWIHPAAGSYWVCSVDWQGCWRDVRLRTGEQKYLAAVVIQPAAAPRRGERDTRMNQGSQLYLVSLSSRQRLLMCKDNN